MRPSPDSLLARPGRPRPGLLRLLTVALVVSAGALAAIGEAAAQSPPPQPASEEEGLLEGFWTWLSGGKDLETAEEKYQKGLALIAEGDFTPGIAALDRVLEEHPYSARAVDAEFRIALAQYFAGQKLDAEAGFSEFRRQHPSHDLVPWAIYYEAMCRYTQIDTVDRDQSATRLAIDRFRLLEQRFPDHFLTSLSERRKEECLEMLAQHELYVADFYFRQDDFRASAGRAAALLRTYPDSSVEPDALLLLGRAQRERQQWDEAEKALDRLQAEHPASSAARRAPSLREEVQALRDASPEEQGEPPDEEDDGGSIESYLGRY